MKCFVTGATGFIGSFLVRHLLDQGCEVHALIRRPDSQSCWRLADATCRIQMLEGDLDHLDSLTRPMLDLRPDAIFHLAWKGVSAAERNSSAQLIQNVRSTLTMLDLCQRCDCPVFVGLGSQAEYGFAGGMLSEDSPCNPVTAYGVAKHSLSALVSKFGDIAQTRVLWFRLFSAYGPTDDKDHLIPFLIRKLLDGICPPLTLGEQMWDYLYVQDAVEAMFAAALCQNAEGIYNLASGQTTSLRSVIESVRDLVDPGIALHFGELPYRTDQVMHLAADISRLRLASGWQPKVSLDEGLRRTVDWQRHFQSRIPNQSVRSRTL